MSNDNVFDLVVVGAGIAGLAAATSAVEAGLSTVLIEKTDAIGGSSAMSGGWFAFCGTDEQNAEGIQDSREQFLTDLLAVGSHRNDVALLEAYLDNQENTYRWLKQHGVHFREVEISSGQSIARGHNAVMSEVLGSLHQAFTAGGGVTVLGHRGERLLRSDGAVVDGIAVRDEDGSESVFIARRGVVLATGGFSRSTELLKIFAPEQLAAIPYGGRANTGDGLRMAWKLGAGMADMSVVSATYGSHPDTTEEFHELLTAYYMGAIIVNSTGQRFIDESTDYKHLGRKTLEQPDGLGYQIFDAKVRALSHRGVALKDIDTLEDLGHVFRADTLEELADRAGIGQDALVATVERYNRAIAEAAPDEQGRTHLCAGAGELLSIDSAPYFAYPAKPLMTTTFCGVTVNPNGQVIDVDGNLIQGLYAIGEVIGGFHGEGYMTGSSLGKGAVFGRIVAAHAASGDYDSGIHRPIDQERVEEKK